MSLLPINAFKLAGYNWKKYLTAFIALTMLLILYFNIDNIKFLKIIVLVLMIAILWFTFSSFISFYWLFDISKFSKWDWVTTLIEYSPKTCLLLSTGLKENAVNINKLFPKSNNITHDIYNKNIMPESALNLARKKINSASTNSTHLLPIENSWAELTIVSLSVHEIRNQKARTEFFHELRRITKKKHTIILIEHIRNFLSFLTLGPSAYHYYPHKEWIRLAKASNFKIVNMQNITPFVRVFTLSKS